MTIRLPKLRPPSWREAFFLLLSFTAVSAVTWSHLLSGWVRDHSGLADSWFELWERCRVSVETRAPLNTTGLQPVAIVESPTQTTPDARRILGRPGERFAIEEREYETGTGNLVSRACGVVFQDWGRPVTDGESAVLLAAFMRQRSELLADGTHEVRDPTTIHGLISAGFGPIVLNPSGCRVIAGFFINSEAATFNSMVGEQALHSRCGGPSLLRQSTVALVTLR
jgi:hypothetical protein